MSLSGDSPHRSIARSVARSLGKAPRRPIPGRENLKYQESPNENKIADIYDKFKKLQSKTEVEKKNKIGFIEQCLGKLEKESGSNGEYETKFRYFKDEVCNLQDNLNSEIKHRSILQDNFEKSMRHCEESLKNTFEMENIERRETEDRIDKMIEEKSYHLSIANSKDQKEIEDLITHNLEEVDSNIADLKEGVESEAIQREEGIVLMTEKIDKETDRLTTELNIENKIREESAKKLESLIEETFENLVDQLVREKQERKENSDNILKLLEDTCNKLDRRLTNY